MADFQPDVTKQNITELLYKASLINNTDVQESAALSALVVGIVEQGFFTVGDVQLALSAGDITEDTYVFMNAPAFGRFVDTAKRIVDNYQD